MHRLSIRQEYRPTLDRRDCLVGQAGAFASHGLDAEPVDALEVSDIVGQQGQVVLQRRRADQCVEVVDQLPAQLQAGLDSSEYFHRWPCRHRTA